MEELTHMVQYRRTTGDFDLGWHTMAAFDCKPAADEYAKTCSAWKPDLEFRVKRRLKLAENDPLGNLNIGKEIVEADKRLAISSLERETPLDITIRSIALSVAQRHCGDTVVSEGNLYQQLKLDNKLGGPLTVEHVVHCALIFEMYLWGKWSQDIAGKAMEATLGELDKTIKSGAFDKHIDELKDEPPIRPHSGNSGE